MQVLSKRAVLKRPPSILAFSSNLSLRDSRGTYFESPASTLIYSKLKEQECEVKASDPRIVLAMKLR